MEIILLDTLENLGKLGERVNVKPGYARNFLIPGGKAMTATKANLELFEARRAELEKAQADLLAAAAARARAVEGIEVTIARKVGDEGRLFGSVGPQDIASALVEAGAEVQRNAVRLLEGPLRQAGEHTVTVRFGAEIDATVKVIIVAEA